MFLTCASRVHVFQGFWLAVAQLGIVMLSVKGVGMSRLTASMVRVALILPLKSALLCKRTRVHHLMWTQNFRMLFTGHRELKAAADCIPLLLTCRGKSIYTLYCMEGRR